MKTSTQRSGKEHEVVRMQRVLGKIEARYESGRNKVQKILRTLSFLLRCWEATESFESLEEKRRWNGREDSDVGRIV